MLSHLPVLLPLLSQQRVLETSINPQPSSKGRVVDLKAVVDPDGVAALGLARCCCQGQSAKEGDIVTAQGLGPKIAQNENPCV